MNKQQIAATIVIGVGLALSFGSALIPRLIPEQRFWSEEEAVEQGAASTRLHQATFEAAYAKDDAQASDEQKTHAAQQLAAARARFDQSREALERAQFWRKTVPKILRWSGAALALLGVVALLSVNSNVT